MLQPIVVGLSELGLMPNIVKMPMYAVTQPSAKLTILSSCIVKVLKSEVYNDILICHPLE